MNAWWDALTNVQKIFWCIAVFSSVFFLIQIVLILIGLDGHGDTDTGGGDIHTDTHGDIYSHGDTDHPHGDSDLHDSINPLTKYFSVRNMVAFLMGFSWGGLGFIDLKFSNFIATVLATGVGLAFVLIMMGLLKVLSKLRSDGTISLRNAVGESATVSIQIPGNMSGSGKVSLTIQERYMEVEAVTKGETLKRSDAVKVTGVSGDRIIVQKAS